MVSVILIATVIIGILDAIGLIIIFYIASRIRAELQEEHERQEREKEIMLEYREGDYSQYLQNVEPDSEPDTITE